MYMECKFKTKLQAYAAGESLALALSGTRLAILKTRVSGPVSLELMFDHAGETQDQLISRWEDMLFIQKVIFRLSYSSLYKLGERQ